MKDKNMTLKEFIQLTNKPGIVKINDIDVNAVRPHIICGDDSEISVQASTFHYCCPRLNNQDVYENYEVMFYGDIDLQEMLTKTPKKYKDAIQYLIDDGSIDSGENVVSHVPHDILEKYILAHGGIKYIKDMHTRKQLSAEDYIKYILNYGK